MTDAGSDHVTLAETIEPQAGHPWRVEVATTYRLSANGLVQTITARNESAEPAPWGTSPHPHPVAGERATTPDTPGPTARQRPGSLIPNPPVRRRSTAVL